MNKIYVIKCKKDNIDIKFPYTAINADIDTNDNICDKFNYCELRAQYYIWKNSGFSSNDFIGFFHYRRYLDLFGDVLKCKKNMTKYLPYKIVEQPNENVNFKVFFENNANYDIIAPLRESVGVTVFENYKNSKKHNICDLYNVMYIIKKYYPEYISSMNEYIYGSYEYYCNMYIMKYSIFNEYCEWLFDILNKFDKMFNSHNTNCNGYLGERLFGIYFTWLKSKNNVKCGELQRLHFYCYDDINHSFRKKRIINNVLKPGSRTRCFIKKISVSLRR